MNTELRRRGERMRGIGETKIKEFSEGPEIQLK